MTASVESSMIGYTNVICYYKAAYFRMMMVITRLALKGEEVRGNDEKGLWTSALTLMFLLSL
jgi:hypothetical protein